MAIKPNFSIVASAVIVGFGSVSIQADLSDEAKRSVQHIVFHDVTVPATGKTPASEYSSSVSELRKLSDFIPDVKDEKVVPTLKRNLNLAGQLLSAERPEGTTLTNFIVSACVELNTFLEENKPAAPGAGPRNVEATVIKLMADLMLVLAEKESLMDIEDVMDYLTDSRMVAAKNAATTKATKFGRNTLGEYRLQAARTKADSTTDEAGE